MTKSGLLVICLDSLLLWGMSTPPARGVTAVPTLEEALDKTAKSVALFGRQISSVACTERVIQEKVGKQGKVEYRQNAVYDTLVLLKINGDSLKVEESRLPKKEAKSAPDPPLLLSSGIQTLMLIFHPYYRDSYTYRMEGEEVLEGKNLVRIRFEHLAGMRSTSALALRGHLYPLEMEGTAWMEPQSGAIRKISANLKTPMDTLNVRNLKITVEYQPQRFTASSETFCLPTTATVDLETGLQRWHNVHRFLEYRRFTVKSEDVISK
jgi:hypothetical protein